VRIARIWQVAAAVEAVVHPVHNAAFETFVELPLEIGGVLLCRAGRGRSSLCERDPEVVGAEDRGSGHAANLKRIAARLVHPQKPNGVRFVAVGDFAARDECEQLAVGTPTRTGGTERGIGDSRRRGGAVRGSEPDFALPPVFGFDNVTARESNPATVGRNGGAVGALDAEIVFQFQRPFRSLGVLAGAEGNSCGEECSQTKNGYAE